MKVKLNLHGEISTILIDTKAILFTLTPTMIHEELPQSNKNILVLGVSSQVQRVLLLEPMTVILGYFSESHTFLLCDTTSLNFVCKELLSKL